MRVWFNQRRAQSTHNQAQPRAPVPLVEGRGNESGLTCVQIVQRQTSAVRLCCKQRSHGAHHIACEGQRLQGGREEGHMFPPCGCSSDSISGDPLLVYVFSN